MLAVFLLMHLMFSANQDRIPPGKFKWTETLLKDVIASGTKSDLLRQDKYGRNALTQVHQNQDSLRMNIDDEVLSEEQQIITSEITQNLLERGSEIAVLDFHDICALDYAVMTKYSLPLLLKPEVLPIINHIRGMNMEPPLCLAMHAKAKSVDNMTLLIKFGAKVDVRHPKANAFSIDQTMHDTLIHEQLWVGLQFSETFTNDVWRRILRPVFYETKRFERAMEKIESSKIKVCFNDYTREIASGEYLARSPIEWDYVQKMIDQTKIFYYLMVLKRFSKKCYKYTINGPKKIN